jgi:hypothetical protein
MNRRRGLHLVGGRDVVPPPPRRAARPKRPPSRAYLVVEATLLMSAGVGVLILLLQLPELIDLDSLLLLSTALGHLIGGLSQLLMGVLQLLGVLLLVSLALLSLLLLVAGMVRLGRAALRKPIKPQTLATARLRSHKR